MKVHPEFQDRAYTFYHMTHKGNVENERVPDLRRCERMPWAKPTVEILPQKGEVKCWEQTRSGKHRVCIWLEVDDGDNYFVVLDVRKTFVLLWTAFYADYPHQVRKKAKEYEELQSDVYTAARRGYVDTVIDPAETRKYVIGAFEMLYTKREMQIPKKHSVF